MAEGRVAIALLAALAGAVAAAEGDGRGAVEPQAVTISVATRAKTADAQPDVSPGSHDRTSGLYAMRIALGDGPGSLQGAARGLFPSTGLPHDPRIVRIGIVSR